MSGMDLPGVSSLTRTDLPAHAVLSVERAAPHGTSSKDRATDDSPGPCPRAEAADHSRSGLPSSVIHELRTPLTSIHGYAQVLQRNLRDNARVANALSVVVRESARLSAMLEELSEMAELESEPVRPPATECSVEHVVHDVRYEVERQDGSRHPILIEGRAMACCHPGSLARALAHVLTNATLYSEPGSPIDVRITRRGRDVEIEVRDGGIGILPGDAERIYQPFERGVNARPAGVRGLGLGLFLARRALASTGGRLSHESRKGRTTFRIAVPALQQAR